MGGLIMSMLTLGKVNVLRGERMFEPIEQDDGVYVIRPKVQPTDDGGKGAVVHTGSCLLFS